MKTGSYIELTDPGNMLAVRRSAVRQASPFEIINFNRRLDAPEALAYFCPKGPVLVILHIMSEVEMGELLQRHPEGGFWMVSGSVASCVLTKEARPEIPMGWRVISEVIPTADFAGQDEFEDPLFDARRAGHG